MNKPVITLMQREMDRREFLLTLGLGVASIFGFSTIIHLLSGKSVESRIKQRVDGDYSADNYGGKTTKSGA